MHEGGGGGITVTDVVGAKYVCGQPWFWVVANRNCTTDSGLGVSVSHTAFPCHICFKFEFHSFTVADS